MKMNNCRSSLAWVSICWITGSLAARAQVYSVAAGLSIPDGDAAGVASSLTVASSVTSLTSLRVNLDISGKGGRMNNGDLFVTLSHESAPNVVDAYVVLLNRPGKTSLDIWGYYDNGLNVAFDSRATGYDIHNYRRHVPSLNAGSDSISLSGPLTGTWQPDGRNVSPDLVLDTTARSTSFNSFQGINPSGKWVLFAADLYPDAMGYAQLNSWSIEVNPYVQVPEASQFSIVLGLTAFGFTAWKRCQRR